MSKQEFQEWIKSLEEQGYDDAEIESIIQDYLDQPENPEWFFEAGV